MRQRKVAALGCVVLAAVLASCSGGRTLGTPRESGTSATTLPSYEVKTGDANGLGAILVDGGGYTLYLFMPDAHSSKSQCSGICAAEWPPLLLPKGTTSPRGGRGIDTQLLGTTTRSDGSLQVTYAGWPLYLWPDDISPGQATGQGINNVGGLWYVVSPQGNPIRK